MTYTTNPLHAIPSVRDEQLRPYNTSEDGRGKHCSTQLSYTELYTTSYGVQLYYIDFRCALRVGLLVLLLLLLLPWAPASGTASAVAVHSTLPFCLLLRRALVYAVHTH